MPVKCVGFITDLHIPFHNRRATAAALNCLADSRLSALYLGGDILDMYWAHGYGAKHPSVLSSFESEREAGVNFLNDLDRTWPRIPKHFVEGNHETRFERWLVNNAPALFGITDMRLLLGFDKRPTWRYHDFGPNQLVRVESANLFAKHAPKGSSGSTIMNHAGCNLIFGHIHRIISERKTTADKKPLHICSPGWLGDARNDKVFGYVPGHHNWQNGFARIWIDTDKRTHTVEIVEIINGRECMASGRRYRG